MRHLLYVICSIFFFFLHSFSQSFQSYRDLKTVCDASLVESKKILVSKNFGNLVMIVGEDWGVSYQNMDNSAENVTILIDPKQITYTTADRPSFLKIIESASSSKLLKELSDAEKRDLGFIQGKSVFKGEGGYFAYSQAKDDATGKFVYSISWISTGTVITDLKGKSNTGGSAKIEKQRKDNYKEIQEDIANRTPLNYVLFSVGGWLASEEFQSSTGSSTNLQSVYTSSKKFGGDVLGLNIGMGGIYSPRGLNSRFRSNFDISFRYGLSYSGIGFSLGIKDPSGYDYSSEWFSNVAGGFGPALSFSSYDNDYAISFYYLPQLNYNFGGTSKSSALSTSEESMERDSKQFGYRGSFGIDIKLSGFYLGFEYGKSKDFGMWKYTSTSFTAPVDVKTKLEMSQIIFKIGFTISD